MDLEAYLLGRGDTPVDVGEGDAVDLEAVLAVGAPLAHYLVGTGLALDLSEHEARLIPGGVDLGVEMDEAGIDAGYRCGEGEADVAVGVGLRYAFILDLEGLGGHHLEIGLAPLLGLVLHLLPVVALLLLVLDALGIGGLGEQLEGIGLEGEHAGGVGHLVLELHAQGVLIDESRVA